MRTGLDAIILAVQSFISGERHADVRPLRGQPFPQLPVEDGEGGLRRFLFLARRRPREAACVDGKHIPVTNKYQQAQPLPVAKHDPNCTNYI